MYTVTQSVQCIYIYINGMVAAVEGAKRGVTMREDTVSGLMFADDFVGISETPEGMQN